MRTILLASLFAICSEGLSARPAPTLDGVSSYPIEQSISYTLRCPDGVFTIEIIQRRKAPPATGKIVYAGRSIAKRARAPIDGILGQLASFA
jgi:hypothetical protein